MMVEADARITIRIVAVSHYPEFGGPHNQTLRLHKPLQEQGYELITVLPDGPAAERLRTHGAQICTLPLGRFRATRDPLVQIRMLGRLPLDIFRLALEFRQLSPDIVQVYGLTNPHSAIAARILRIPVVWQLLDTRQPILVRNAFGHLVGALSTVVMPVGLEVSRQHPTAKLASGYEQVFYPPVDELAFTPSQSFSLREELNIPIGHPIVGCVANVNPQKGYETFIAAAAMIHNHIPSTKFVIVGHIYPNHKEYFESLQDLCRSFGLVVGTDIFFLGSRADVIDILRNLDVFMMTPVPNSEGTPTAILEAMSCGLPIVATLVASIPEIVEDNHNGFLANPGDAETVANRVVSLLADPTLGKTMGSRSRKLVVENFSINRCVEDHLAAYRLALGQIRVKPAPAIATKSDSHKNSQSSYYDDATDPEFELTRPHGQPRLYEQFLAEKFRRSTQSLGPLSRRSSLTVCGGSGMDAEFLLRSGSKTITTDLALHAVRRARERHKRFLSASNESSTSMIAVADAEHLPFLDQSIDLVYVHDGLHHLEDPAVGLREMCRVASWAVSLTEPADAALTGLAVKLGRAEEIEEAGNRVARLDLPTVTRILESEGFTVVRAQRYAMYYKHKPGWVMRLLSLPVLNPLAWLGFDIGNFLIGRWGNKMTVQAIRTEQLDGAQPPHS